MWTKIIGNKFVCMICVSDNVYLTSLTLNNPQEQKFDGVNVTKLKTIFYLLSIFNILINPFKGHVQAILLLT